MHVENAVVPPNHCSRECALCAPGHFYVRRTEEVVTDEPCAYVGCGFVAVAAQMCTAEHVGRVNRTFTSVVNDAVALCATHLRYDVPRGAVTCTLCARASQSSTASSMCAHAM